MHQLEPKSNGYKRARDVNSQNSLLTYQGYPDSNNRAERGRAGTHRPTRRQDTSYQGAGHQQQDQSATATPNEGAGHQRMSKTTEMPAPAGHGLAKRGRAGHNQTR